MQVAREQESETNSNHANRKSSWETFWSRRKRIHVYENVAELAHQALGNLQGARVLEVGCGRGATLLSLIQRGAQGTGLDYAESAIAFCNELKQSFGVNGQASFVQGDAFQLPFESASFDLVYSIGLIEHFEEPSAALEEQFRVLKPGGCLIVQVPQKYSLYTLVKMPLTRLGYWPYGEWETQFSERELREIVRKAGFLPAHSSGYGSFWLALLRHFFFPNLNFDTDSRLWKSNALLQRVKSNTALDVCLVAFKPK